MNFYIFSVYKEKQVGMISFQLWIDLDDEWEEPLASELMLRTIEAIMRPIIYLSSAKEPLQKGNMEKEKTIKNEKYILFKCVTSKD